MLAKCPGKKDNFKELRVGIVIVLKIIISVTFSAKASCSAYLLIIAYNWRESALFDQKSTTNFSRPFSSFHILFLPQNGNKKHAVFAFQKGKNQRRQQRGLRQFFVSTTPAEMIA